VPLFLRKLALVLLPTTLLAGLLIGCGSPGQPRSVKTTEFHSAAGVLVTYDDGYASGSAKSPLPFADARTPDRRLLLGQLSPPKVVRGQIKQLDGLRVATMEFLTDNPPSVTPPSFVHEVLSASAQSGASRSQIRIAVFCMTGQWAASRATLLAVLASVRFSRPRGLSAAA
jgi:hypothetical protein